jgi:hypothetical protein
MPANGPLNVEGTVSDHRGERRSERRVHLSEAAALLGVSKDAVRMRVKRGTLRSEKGGDGRVYVWVNVVPDGDPNTVHPEAQVDAWRVLIDELRDRVRSLEESNRENRRIIAALTQRIPEIEAPASPPPPGATESATGQPGRVEPQPAVESTQEPGAASEMHMPEAGGGPLPRDQQRAAERRSWWRRLFKG